jgi:hypothetical protein
VSAKISGTCLSTESTSSKNLIAAARPSRTKNAVATPKLVPEKSPALIHEAGAMVTNFFFFCNFSPFLKNIYIYTFRPRKPDFEPTAPRLGAVSHCAELRGR